MELSCPSCGAKHNTEDYPGAFEIACTCGYSLLVPDEKAYLAQTQGAAPSLAPPTSALPTSAEEADRETLLKVESLIVPGVEPDSTGMSGELPSGMIYDAFEFPSGDVAVETNPFTPSFHSPPGEAAGLPPSEPVSASTPRPVAQPMQETVERVVRGQLGQILGRTFSLEMMDLSVDARETLVKRVSRFLDLRPWLRVELATQGFEVERLNKENQFNRIPEVLAVEIYLCVYELGGRCRSHLVSSHESIEHA